MSVTLLNTCKPGLIDSIPAVSDTPQYRFIGFDGDLCAVHAVALGISQQAVDAGDECPVVVDGIMLVELGGTVSLGDVITSTTAGKAIHSTDATWGVNGWAMKAGVSGDIIPIKMP